MAGRGPLYIFSADLRLCAKTLVTAAQCAYYAHPQCGCRPTLRYAGGQHDQLTGASQLNGSRHDSTSQQVLYGRVFNPLTADPVKALHFAILV